MAKLGDRCSFCKLGTLKIIPADEPYSLEHLECPECDSTFNLDNDYVNGDYATGRVHDPSGNEHKIGFIYKDGFWEVD